MGRLPSPRRRNWQEVGSLDTEGVKVEAADGPVEREHQNQGWLLDVWIGCLDCGVAGRKWMQKGPIKRGGRPGSGRRRLFWTHARAISVSILVNRVAQGSGHRGNARPRPGTALLWGLSASLEPGCVGG